MTAQPSVAPGALLRALLAVCVAAVLPLAVPAFADDRVGQALLIRDVRVLDLAGEKPRSRDGQSVLVKGGRIAAVAPSDRLAAPSGAKIVEGRGRTLVPGLADMHVHIWDEAELGAYLASGVTTVRNMSGMPYLLDIRDRIASGQLSGPRIVTTGPILNSPGPNAQLNHQMVETADEGRQAVRAQHDRGYRRIKVYSNLTREAYRGIRSEAKLLAMPITGHTPEGVRFAGVPDKRPFDIAFSEILDDDWEAIEHVESIVWHGLGDRHDPVQAKELAGRIAESGIPVDPTLIAFANLARIAETHGAHLRREGTDTLNPFIRSMETAQSERWTNEDAPRARAQLAFYLDFTRLLSEEGVLLVAGSDSGIGTNIPGVSLHDELDLLVAAGLTPFEALRSATVNAARVMGEEGEFGGIAPGQRADLLLVDGDPLRHLELLRRPDVVVAGGSVYDAGQVAALRQSAATTDADRTARNVLGAMEAQGTKADLAN